MRDPHKIVKNFMVTEKGTTLGPYNKYLFAVDMKANKIEIRKAVEELYKVKVAKVNTMVVPGKRKRVRYEAGYTSEWKKAVVTLKEGYKIEVA